MNGDNFRRWVVATLERTGFKVGSFKQGVDMNDGIGTGWSVSRLGEICGILQYWGGTLEFTRWDGVTVWLGGDMTEWTEAAQEAYDEAMDDGSDGSWEFIEAQNYVDPKSDPMYKIN